jgi:hypothetical protein
MPFAVAKNSFALVGWCFDAMLDLSCWISIRQLSAGSCRTLLFARKNQQDDENIRWIAFIYRLLRGRLMQCLSSGVAERTKGVHPALEAIP